MVHEPEFVRGNQKNFIRIPCEAENLNGYEYQMCLFNKIDSLLISRQRSQNGINYLYYEISGMQSLDIYLQTQKLKRPFAIQLAKAIVRLCRQLSEYALDIDKVKFVPKYVMVSANGEKVYFLYTFAHSEESLDGLEQLLESCVEYLDYQDELLMEKVFGLYEHFTEQKANFLVEAEMERVSEALIEPSVADIAIKMEKECVAVPLCNIGIEESTEIEEMVCGKGSGTNKKSQIAQKEYGGLKRGLLILLILDIAVLIFWQPLTLLKLFFAIAVGLVLLWLNMRAKKRDEQQRDEQQTQRQEEIYMEEYKNLSAQNCAEDNFTQLIVAEDSERVLYNLQGYEPKCIHIDDNKKIIGKDSERTQIQIEQEGISRVHALVVKEGEECIIEDLNSTNGTWINGKPLEPRKRYVLKEGDKVRLAGLEYIFR